MSDVEDRVISRGSPRDRPAPPSARPHSARPHSARLRSADHLRPTHPAGPPLALVLTLSLGTASCGGAVGAGPPAATSADGSSVLDAPTTPDAGSRAEGVTLWIRNDYGTVQYVFVDGAPVGIAPADQEVSFVLSTGAHEIVLADSADPSDNPVRFRVEGAPGTRFRWQVYEPGPTDERRIEASAGPW